MNEPKRRGRPPKAAIEGADALVLPVREMKFATFAGGNATRFDPDKPIQFFPDPVAAQLAQAYALRVWNGQSPNVPRNERIKRVMAALNGQNLPTEGIELP